MTGSSGGPKPPVEVTELDVGQGYGGGECEPGGARLALGASEVRELSREPLGRTPRLPLEPSFEKEVLFNRHCVGRGNTGSLELSQPPAFRLFGFVCFFGLFFFSFFFGLIVLIKSFCPVLFFTGLTMLQSAQRGFLCFCPSTGLRWGLASCCELSS